MSRILIATALLVLSSLPAQASSQNAVPGTVDGQQSFRAPYPSQAPQMPVNPGNRPIACTMEAKMCPDGSYVSRTGPNCEFAPCPGGTGGAMPVPQPPEEPQGVPDLPLVGVPSSAVSVEFLTTHRTALSGKILTVTGYVTDYCGANDECGEPRIILNDEADGSGPYSMSVYMSSSDPTTYTVGQQVEIYGEASSEGDTAALRKE
ncbi:MAG: hypothetical protein ACAH80_14995 [Alphaproteobacteria bacterium]